MLRLGDNFITSLNKVYGIYTLGFLGFVILMAILEVAGVSNTIIGWLLPLFSLRFDWGLSRTMQSSQYVAGRKFLPFIMVWQQRIGCRELLL